MTLHQDSASLQDASALLHTTVLCKQFCKPVTAMLLHSRPNPTKHRNVHVRFQSV